MTRLISRMSPAEPATLLSLQPGRIVELAGSAGMGLTRLGLHMLAGPSAVAPVVALDARGWLAPRAAWEVGVERERLVVVRCPDPRRWPGVMAAVCEGVRAVYAEVPAGVSDRDLRRLAALGRARDVAMALRPLRGELPDGVSHLRLRATEVRWEGADRGHGRLGRRTLVLEASGRGVAGIDRHLEVEDDGARGVRVVSGLAAATRGRATG
jgi:hypothetical protein